MTATACRHGELAFRLGLALALTPVGCSSAGEAPDAGASDSSASDASDASASGEGGGNCLVCGSDAAPDAPLYLRVRGVLDQVCGNTDGCHGGGAGNLGIRPGAEFLDLIGVTSSENPPMKRVAPGDPAHSYAYLKLACDGGIVGACMPLGMPSAATAKLFHDWIEAGAPTQ